MTPWATSFLAFVGATAFYTGLVSISFLHFAGGGWLDEHQFDLTPLLVFALFFYSASFSLADVPKMFGVSLNTLMTLSIVFAVPNISYPIGSQYWENIQGAFGKLSIEGMIVVSGLYLCLLFLKVRKRL